MYAIDSLKCGTNTLHAKNVYGPLTDPNFLARPYTVLWHFQ